MRYIVDNDLHIHSNLSSCSQDPEQTAKAILEYAKANGLKRIAITDHYWDAAVEGASGWYKPQDFEHISASRPLPSAEGIEFLFGCETDLRRDGVLGIPKERFKDFDVVIIPTTHMHMNGFTIDEKDTASNERKALLWVSRLDALFSMDLPFGKIGIAHLACSLIANKSREDYLKILSLIPSSEMERVFNKAASLGVGIELNQYDICCPDEEVDTVYRMFRIAKACGCKFYCSSDAHHPADFLKAKERFERAVDILGLTEDDKFIPA
jgi:histidinol phosphatase-like PHP family hydrolase